MVFSLSSVWPKCNGMHHKSGPPREVHGAILTAGRPNLGKNFNYDAVLCYLLCRACVPAGMVEIGSAKMLWAT